MKRLFRYIVSSILERQVKRLRKRNDFKIVAVVGSIGKTSTKLAIGRALSKVSRTRYQEGNYNDRVTVPLVIFGENNPDNVLNVWQWICILVRNELQLRKAYLYDWVVVELGTDAPGQIPGFSYLDVDLTVVTAITPEHMENFRDIDAVAKEELSVAEFSRNLLVNIDLCQEKHLKDIKTDVKTYGTEEGVSIKIGGSSEIFQLYTEGQLIYNYDESDVAKPKKYSVAATLGVLMFAGYQDPKFIQPLLDYEIQTQVQGRMQILSGINNSLIIDDTYNSSPDAVMMALEVLRERRASYKIAILGSMNELGSLSEKLHIQIGESCNPEDIDLLVTIGSEANKYIASAAKRKGCTVKTFSNPYEAGMFVKDQVKPQSLILAKGSQNGVFAEEALKPLLKNKHDHAKLVRQSKTWLNRKRMSFEAKS